MRVSLSTRQLIALHHLGHISHAFLIYASNFLELLELRPDLMQDIPTNELEAIIRRLNEVDRHD